LTLPIKEWRSIEAVVDDYFSQHIGNEDPKTAFEAIVSNMKELICC
jgi:hypothetical protein